MRNSLLLALLVISLSIPFCSGAVQEVSISPENPVQGDTLDIYIKADPGETLPVVIVFERELETTNDKYIMSVSDLRIPDPPNKFKVRAWPVSLMTVILNSISTTVTAENGIASISHSDISGGEYTAKVRGTALSGTQTVNVRITAESRITTDDSGEYHYIFPTSDIPAGEYTADVDGETVAINVGEPEASDSVPPTIIDNSPTGIVSSTSPLVSASYSDDVEIDTSSVSLKINGVDVTGQSSVSSSGINYQCSGLSNYTSYNVALSVKDTSGNQVSKSWSFTVQLPSPPDTISPYILDYYPTGKVDTETVDIIASVWDNKKIETVSLKVRGTSVASTLSGDTVSYSIEDLVDGETVDVQLTITDKAGNTASKSWSFNVELPEAPVILPNQDPVPAFEYPDTILTGLRTLFDASGSLDSDGIIVSYSWSIDQASYVGVKVQHVFAESGAYSVTLTVIDNRGASKSTSQIVQVFDASEYPPNAEAGSNRIGFTGQTITFDASNSHTLVGEITNYTWDFGDGVNAYGVSATHQYVFPGSYVVSLTVVNSLGSESTDQLHVKVIQQPETEIIEETLLGVESENQYNYSELGVKVRVNASRVAHLLVFQYKSFNGSTPQTNSIPRIVDVSVSDPDAVDWPLYVELEYNETGLNEEYLSLYYYLNGSWRLCNHTGVDTDRMIAWSYLSRSEAVGSPLIIAETLSPANITHVGTTITPVNPKEGESVEVVIDYQNSGETSGEALIAIVVDNEALVIDTLDVPALGQASYSYTTIFSSPGEHIVQVQEAVYTIQVEPLLPDLEITSIEAPTTYRNGESFQINVTVANNGEAPCNSSLLRVLVDNETLVDVQVTVLEPRTGEKLIFPITLTGEVSEFTVIVDPDNMYNELDKENNTLIQPITLEKDNTSGTIIVVIILLSILLFLFRDRLGRFLGA